MTDGVASAVSDFHEAVNRLHSFAKESHLLGPNFGVAMAVLLHRSDPTRFVIPASGAPTSTGDLQKYICDPTWTKSPTFVPAGAEGSVYKPFTQSFKSHKKNNWRNSFDIQGGLGCSAPFTPAHFQSAAFIAEHRFDCSFREPTNGSCGATSTGALCFDPDKKGFGIASWSKTNARYRPKLLRRTSGGGSPGYWSVEPTVDSLVELLGRPEARVPASDFATVLFAGSPYWSQWSTDRSPRRLQVELQLDDEQFFAVFTGTSAIVGANGSALESHTVSSQNRGGNHALATTAIHRDQTNAPTDYTPRDTEVTIEIAGREPDPERRRRLLENATQGHRRVLNVLADTLVSRGFVVEEQTGGFDLHAYRTGGQHILFEAKTWTPANLASQVRSGWAQLEEYAFRSQAVLGDSPDLALVLNHQPPADFWAWDWFYTKRRPYVLWLSEDGLETFSHSADWLNELLRPLEEPG